MSEAGPSMNPNPTQACPRPPDPRLERLLGGEELAALRQRLRRHVLRLETDDAATTVRLANLDPATHQALCRLSGRPARPARSMVLDIGRLDASLRSAGVAASLREALETLDGPIVDRNRQRIETQARWTGAMSSIDAGNLLRDWLSTTSAVPLLKRLARVPERVPALLEAANRVLCALPAHGQPRSQLAAEWLGDAHALDAGRPVATVVLAAWRHHESAQGSRPPASADPRSDAEPNDEPGHDPEKSPDWAPGDETSAEDPASQDLSHADWRQRDVWARAGVLVNELARPVLVLNLPMPRPLLRSPSEAGAARFMPCAGEPAYLSLRQLLRDPPVWPVTGKRIYVCENPNLVAIAADRLGAQCAPLVCTDGMPAAAQRTLLDQLHRAGAQLHYHGDLDWPGIRIANVVIRAWDATPWRMSARDYEDAVGSTVQPGHERQTQTPPQGRLAPALRHTLGNGRVEACWDPRLADVMQTLGISVAEEAVASVLSDDLGARRADADVTG